MKWLLASLVFMFTVALAGAATYVNQTTGNDNNSCTQAQDTSTAKRTINGGISCLQPGGTLFVGVGVYNELLSGQWNSTQVTCQSDLLTIQQPCSPIPAGLSVSQPTSIIGTKGVIISPVGKSFPGGGGIITLGTHSRYITFDGIALITHESTGSGAGLVNGDAQYITFMRGEMDNGSIDAGAGARYLTFTHNDLHHAGRGCDNQTQRTPPCPHCIYVRGQDITITDNLVRYCADYGIQASSEHGGIARVNIQRNIVVGNAGTGIRAACDSCVVAANLLYKNGVGITYKGNSNVVANNTIIGYDPRASDPWGIFGYGGAATVVNNLLYGMKNSWYAMGTEDFSEPNADWAHHNMSEQAGNAGIILIAPASQVFTNYDAQDFTLKSDSAALKKGVSVSQVTQDIQRQPYSVPPDLGADSWSATTPPTPEPEPPRGNIVLNCTGELGAKGVIISRCVQESTR